MKTKKLLFGVGLIVAIGALGLLLWSIIVGIPPRSQSASVYNATSRVAVTTQTAVGDINKIAITGTSLPDPVSIALPDYCPNFTGNQQVVPIGYQVNAAGDCVCPAGLVGLITDGTPTGTIPTCVTLPKPRLIPMIDVCPNIAGIQGIVPVGYHIVEGQCVRIDLCTNIAGVQTTVPAGYDAVGGQCNPIQVGVCSQALDKSFLVGGHDRHTGFADMWSLVSSTLQWTSVAVAPSLGDKAHHASVVFDSRLWVLGGVHTNTNGYVPSNDVWTYNGALWHKESTPPWGARYDASAVVFQNKLWFMGGSDSANGIPGAGYVSMGDTWSFNGTTWTPFDNDAVTPGIQNAPWALSLVTSKNSIADPAWHFNSYNGKTAFKTVVFQNKLWLMGGIQNYLRYDDQGAYVGFYPFTVNDVWSFNGTTWTPFDNDAVTPGIQNAPWAYRADFVLLSFQNKIWLMGGEDINTGHIYNDVWSFNGTTWTRFDNDSVTPGIQNAPWQARAQFSGIVSNNKIYIAGGDPNSDPMLNDVWSFDGITWTKVDNATTAGIQNAPWGIRDGMTWVSCQ